jgi:putative FmdB family regulatory protein
VPTYQYTCTECEHDLEAVQKFTDDPLTECPECKGRLRKVFSAVGVVFKGSGFYRTDSRAKSSAADPPSSSKDSGSSSKDAGSKSESAPKKSESSTKTSESAA